MSTQKLLLSIDQGTTSSKATLFDEKCRVVKVAQKELKRYFPKNGYVEQNPEEIIGGTFDAVKEVLSGLENAEIVGLGIVNQRETIILWDKETGKALYNAIVWQDRRIDNWCVKNKEEFHRRFHKKTGLVLDAYFSASKIKWVLENVKEAQELLLKKRLLFGTVDCFLLWNLTKGGKHESDLTNASRTLLCDITKCDWDEELLDFFNIPKEILPKITNSISDFGVVDKSLFGFEIKIRAMLGDQQAATIGQACLKEKMGKITFGTGCFMMLNVGSKPIYSKNGLLTTPLYGYENKAVYALEGACFYAGAVVQWLRDDLGLIHDASETEDLAKNAKQIDSLYFVPAFGGLGAPYWNNEAKAIIKGITNNVGKNEIVRAALDGVIFQSLDLVKTMESDGIKFEKIRIDGGMAKNDWFNSRLCDILKTKIEIPKDIESTSLGGAFFAGIGAGLFKFDDLEELHEIREVKNPRDVGNYEELILGWNSAVKKT